MATTTRWNSVRLEQKVSRAARAADPERLLSRLDAAAERVAGETSDAIKASGRGGAHNSDFANIERRVWIASSGRINVNLGWLNPPSNAREKGGGGKLWYQYQDSGFHLFGGSRWIDGVGATLDQRYRLIDALNDELRSFVNDVERAFH